MLLTNWSVRRYQSYVFDLWLVLLGIHREDKHSKNNSEGRQKHRLEHFRLDHRDYSGVLHYFGVHAREIAFLRIEDACG